MKGREIEGRREGAWKVGVEGKEVVVARGPWGKSDKRIREGGGNWRKERRRGERLQRRERKEEYGYVWKEKGNG